MRLFRSDLAGLEIVFDLAQALIERLPGEWIDRYQRTFRQIVENRRGLRIEKR